MENLILGISAGFHDSSACLVDYSGNIIFASSEERFSRVKGDKSFPDNAINACIEKAKFIDKEINMICCHEDPSRGFPRNDKRSLKQLINQLILKIYKIIFFKP